MAVLIDRLISAGIGKETTRGTKVSAAYWMPHQEFSMQDKVEYAIEDSGIGRIEQQSGAEVVQQWSEGSLSGYIYHKSIGLILLAAFGSVSSAANADASGTIKDHTFSVATSNSHPSLTLVSKDANDDLALANAMLKSLEITADLKKFAAYKADFVAKASTSASSTVALATEYRFRPQDVTVKIASTVAGLSGATATKLRSVSLKIEKNADPEFALGSIDPDDIYNKQFACSLSLEALYRDTTWKDLVRNGTTRAISISLANNAATIGTAAHPTLTFTFQPGVFTNRSKDGGLDDLKTEKVDFIGLFSAANTEAVKAVLTNEVTSY